MVAEAVLERTRQARRDGRTLRLACFGSSTTEGYGASGPAAAYPAVARAWLLPSFAGGIALGGFGVSGESAIEMDGRVAEVAGFAADLVIWQTGSNDVSRPVPLSRFEALTRRGLEVLRRTGADLVLMDQQFSTALEAFPAIEDYRRTLHRLADEAGVPVFPRYDTMRRWCGAGRFGIDTLSPDGTHMGDAGYRALGEAVAEWILHRC